MVHEGVSINNESREYTKTSPTGRGGATEGNGQNQQAANRSLDRVWKTFGIPTEKEME